MASPSSSYPRHNAFHGIEALSRSRKSVTTLNLFDVFINQHGPDVNETLAIKLYNSFHEVGLRPFLDSRELELGDSLPSALRYAICSAPVHVAIFSKGYAASPSCLHELVLMVKTGAEIIPVFYDVAPFDLCYIENGVYADAFSQYKRKGAYLDMLEESKKALHLVSNIIGYECSKHNHDEDELYRKIVSAVLKEVQKTTVSDVEKCPVLELNELVQDFERECMQKSTENNRVKIVGIFGKDGLGKTTLAKKLFNLKRSEYYESCFLFDVREASLQGELTILQAKLLNDLVHEESPKFSSTDEGTSYLKARLGRVPFPRFLIVVDDIGRQDQLDAVVVKDQLTSDCLVIVTTHDERVLIRAGITIRYKMKERDPYHSSQLFCWHAFGRPYPASGYEDLAKSFVEACGSLPLSLRVLGSHVCGSTDKSFWEMELDKIRRILPGDTKQHLKICFDSLDSDEKQMFIDIACFFNGKTKYMAMKIWEGLGWKAEEGLEILIDKNLVKLVSDSSLKQIEHEDGIVLRMHHHLRDLGREMADEMSSPRRLWRPQDLKSVELKGFESILPETDGHSLRCYESSLGVGISYFSANSALELELNEHEHISIPSWIPLRNLRCLRISNGHLKRLWRKDEQQPMQLREVNIFGSIQKFPKSIGQLQQLEKVVIDDWLNTSMKALPEEFCHLQLKHLTLRWCTALTSLPTHFAKLTKLQHLDLAFCNELTELPRSFKQLKQLQYLSFEGCSNLKLPPHFLGEIETLRHLNFKYCLKLAFLPTQVPRQVYLRSLNLGGTSLEELPFEVGLLINLEVLEIGSPYLTDLPDTLGNLTNLKALNIEGCRNLTCTPDSLSLLINVSINLPESLKQKNIECFNDPQEITDSQPAALPFADYSENIKPNQYIDSRLGLLTNIYIENEVILCGIAVAFFKKVCNDGEDERKSKPETILLIILFILLVARILIWGI